jgi:hypothetical protein
MMLQGAYSQGLIHQITRDSAGGPLRCSGCGWSSSDHGPDVVFLSFSMPLFRGVMVDKGSHALLERLDDLVLCAECVAVALLVLDPTPARSARQRIVEVQAALRDEIERSTKAVKACYHEVAKIEGQLEEVRKARDELEGLRDAVAQWTVQWDLAVEVFRRERLNVWTIRHATTLERASSAGDEADELAAELADAAKLFVKARRGRRVLKTAGERLKAQSETKGLSTEVYLIQNRLTAAEDSDDR